MEKKSKKSIIIGLVSLFIVMLLLLGLTYAYYRTRVIGNQSTDPSLSVVSKNLGVSYSDNNSKISATGVEPGFDDTKTFSVENTGGETVTYEVYLENVVNEYTRTQDWTYSITCVDSNGDQCDGISERNYPQLSGRIIETSIASGVTQTYTLTLKYANSTENQSDDMGKKLEGKIQIYSPEYVVDIEGDIAGAEAGDYVQINSVKKTSGIVDGRYKLVGVEAGNHTLTVRNKDGVIKGSAQITIEQGATSGVNGTTITTTEASETITINILSISTNLGLDIKGDLDGDFGLTGDESGPWNEAEEGTLLYALKTNQPSGTEETIPGEESSTENEARVLEVNDDDGISYVYRGNVENNYVNFAEMCWRVVRVQGDGSTKLILEDKNTTCNDDDNSDNIVYTGEANFKWTNYGSKKVYEGDFYHGVQGQSTTPWTMYEGDFKEGLAITAEEFEKEKLSQYTSLLKNGPWCTGYTKSYVDTAGTNVRPRPDNISFSSWKKDETENFYFYNSYYDSYIRINNQKNPTLNCIGNKVENYKSGNKMYVGALTADEVQFVGNSESSYLVNSYILENGMQWFTLTNAKTHGEGFLHESFVYTDEVYGFATKLSTIMTMYDDAALRPSINLIENIKIKNSNSDGTRLYPYEIDYEI